MLKRNNIIRVIQVLLLLVTLGFSYLAFQVYLGGKQLNEVAEEVPIVDVSVIKEYQTNKEEFIDKHNISRDLLEVESPLTFTTDHKLEEEVLNGYYIGKIEIPKINVSNRIYLGASRGILMVGVGIMNGTDIPSIEGGTNSVIAGHRGYRGVGTFFQNINKLSVGDDIIITTPLYRLTYKVTGQKVVKPTEIQHMDSDGSKSLLTLVTCTPMYVWTDRLLVDAELVSYEMIAQ